MIPNLKKKGGYSLNDRYSALITGGSRGIGKATVEIYKSRGYDVTYPGHSELDLSSIDSVDDFLKNNKEHFDILINNAGINEVEMMGEVSDEKLKDTMMVNSISPFRIANHFIHDMRKNGFGRVVNVASIWSVKYRPGRGSYSVSKHAIHGLTVALASEYGQHGILSNTVSPGFTLTEMTNKNNTSRDIEEISKKIPIGRMADVNEIAKVIYYIGSENNTYINGQNIIVDGGFSII